MHRCHVLIWQECASVCVSICVWPGGTEWRDTVNNFKNNIKSVSFGTSIMGWASSRGLGGCRNVKKKNTKKNSETSKNNNTKLSHSHIVYADLIEEYLNVLLKRISNQINSQPRCCCYRVNWTVHLWYLHGCRCFVSPLVF